MSIILSRGVSCALSGIVVIVTDFSLRLSGPKSIASCALRTTIVSISVIRLLTTLSRAAKRTGAPFSSITVWTAAVPCLDVEEVGAIRAQLGGRLPEPVTDRLLKRVFGEADLVGERRHLRIVGRPSS